MSQEIISITFTDFIKTQQHLKPNQGKMLPWFKLSSNFCDDDRFEKDVYLRMVYIYLCCKSAQTGSSELIIYVDIAARKAAMTKKQFMSCIVGLDDMGLIQNNTSKNQIEDLEERDINGHLKATDSQAETEKKKRNKQIQSDFLDSIYAAYPRKVKGKEGKRRLAKEVNTNQDIDDLDNALNNYLAHIDKNKIELKYVMHFSTFASTWRDWISNESVQDLNKPVFEKNPSRYV